MSRAIFALICAALAGCGSRTIYDKRPAIIESASGTYANDGTCSFTVSSANAEAQWLWKEPNARWYADCDSFRVGDTVWIEIGKAKK